MLHTWGTGNMEVEAEGSEIQSQQPLPSKYRATVGYMRFYLNKTEPKATV